MTSAAREQMRHHPDLPDELFRCDCGRYFVDFDVHFPYFHQHNHCIKCGRLDGGEKRND